MIFGALRRKPQGIWLKRVVLACRVHKVKKGTEARERGMMKDSQQLEGQC